MRSIIPAIVCVATLSLAGPPPTAHAAADNAVLKWNGAAIEAVRQSRLAPPAVARALAIVHTCMYDAWAVYDPVAGGVHYHAKELAAASEEHRQRAVSYAAYRALTDLFPAQRAVFDQVMAELGYDPLDSSDPESVRGRDAAQAGLDFRTDDGANQHGGYGDTTGYLPVNTHDVLTDPNRWQPLATPDGAGQVFALPHWGQIVPFALASPDQFRPGPPALYPHGAYRKQALAVLHASASLTDREKTIVAYWADGPRTETPPGHWCLFAQFVSRRDGHDLERDVKLFFVLANGLLDASIAVWDAKRHYDYVRPVTAIRFLFEGRPVRAWAGPFQGTGLIPGETWQSYIPTPPFAEYVSGHSTFSAVSAEVLRLFTGSDTLGAQVTVAAGSSAVEPGLVPRQDIVLSWGTFSEAADEAGISRRLGGIHFEDGDHAGRTLGRRIGARVWQKARAYFSGTAPTVTPEH
jgi:hypothetical protein